MSDEQRSDVPPQPTESLGCLDTSPRRCNLHRPRLSATVAAALREDVREDVLELQDLLDVDIGARGPRRLGPRRLA